MKTPFISVFFISIVALSGCAVKNDKTTIQGVGLTYHSNVNKLDDGNYFTEVEAALFAGRISGATSQASKNAVDYCKAQNKTMKEVRMERDSHLLVNGVARLTFQCIK
ncbi:hypothetical protein [Aeromonas jandaei]|uniref:hypothetical protein n=1 Tax=Aeromonas jandaei TaxID=650 RepID=UPI0038D19895